LTFTEKQTDLANEMNAPTPNGIKYAKVELLLNHLIE
jgi:hypothetical protein